MLDPQSSFRLDPSVIQEAAKSNGILDPANPKNFAKSPVSANNFINLCVGAKVTNGEQIKEGSCNPTPMGFLPSNTHMPSVKIVRPNRKSKLEACEDFNITVALKNIQIGLFTSPPNTYYLAPQFLNPDGFIKGHLHVVAQLARRHEHFDAQIFAFFEGISEPAIGGKVNVTVSGGLPNGIYRISTITTAMNHQTVALPVAQRGAVDDAVYVKVGTGVSSDDIDGSIDSISQECQKAKGARKES
ncbi:hypothetical protein O181_031667 [Austropuccinia psidii MF-1]|uniref:Uncharacterized protein n=1 Tax=Austropuccinia psidii MF-1 TaxID=1389203 RepID=A0A9Q3H5J9_9BASI|nr:hypothetical protein [Austropuccinia psidii MF-1]